jgi:hypothetical protein
MNKFARWQLYAGVLKYSFGFGVGYFPFFWQWFCGLIKSIGNSHTDIRLPKNNRK